MRAPGLSLSNDLRQVVPKPYYEYWVSLLPQSELTLRLHAMWNGGQKTTTTTTTTTTELSPPSLTREYPRQQPSYETEAPVSLDVFGATVRAPLGYIVAGRSGDKASDCNCGFFVRHDDEWDLLRDHLDRGYNGCKTYDTLGKSK